MTIQPLGYIDVEFVDKRKTRSYSLIVPDDFLIGWDILGSNDGTTWDTLFSIRDQTLEAKKMYDFKLNKTALYRHYRLEPKQRKTTAGVKITYFQMYR